MNDDVSKILKLVMVMILMIMITMIILIILMITIKIARKYILFQRIQCNDP